MSGDATTPRDQNVPNGATPGGERVCSPDRQRLPALGPRGEGWVAIQVVLIVAMAAAGLRGTRWPAALRPLLLLKAVALAVIGLALFAGGSRRLGRQLTPFPKPVVDGALKQTGAYRYVRHPIYGGVLLLGLAWSLVTSPLALVPWVLACPFLAAKRRREEAWLCERHPEYADYAGRVTRSFIPYVW